MRFMFVVLAAGLLAACETMSQYAAAQPAPASDSTSAEPVQLAQASFQPAMAAPAPPVFQPPPDQQLLELERQLSAAAQQGGLGGALAPVIDPAEGMSIRSGVIYTAADIQRGLAPPAGAGPIYWQPDRVEVSSSGDMGMTSGRYVQVMTGAEAVQGRYLMVWRRDAGGEWKILTETRIADPPRAARRR